MITAVTGASGHIGQNLVRALLSEGRKVRALIHSDSRGLETLPIEIARGSILHSDFLREALIDVDVVYNAAGAILLDKRSLRDLFEVNVLGTQALAKVCLSLGVKRLVHFSSIMAVSALPSDRPVSESNGFPRKCERPLPYDRSKVEGEEKLQEVIQQGLHAVILNPTAVVGPYDEKVSAMGAAVRDFASNRVPALVPGTVDVVDARDVAVTALSAERNGRPGERYLISGHHVTIKQLAELVAEVAKTKPPRFTCPMTVARLVAPGLEVLMNARGKTPRFTSRSLKLLRRNHRTNSEKAQAELRHQPRSLEETIKDTVAWQRTAGWLERKEENLGA